MIRFFPVVLLSLLAASSLTFCAPAPAQYIEQFKAVCEKGQA